ncbi:Gfo/Idh/MocA family protein [Halomonas sp. V046]|uniref:Gfo/Idh/MocA family protein n=1 Tax=Halomonas sp. V046 TaxID=3459611 RepID=UPI0040442B09
MNHLPVRWGILSTANIARTKLIPAMDASPCAIAHAVGSRSLASAQAFADELGIPRAYASYDEVLDDPAIEAVYIPVPNHLHVALAQKALDKGKHVLCEKPLALTADEARTLRVPAGLIFCEAFMVRHQPRWLALRQRLEAGEIGDVLAIQAMLSFSLDTPGDIRLRPEFGGGALYDLGCYAIMATRFAFGDEPRRVLAHLSRDPEHGVDTRASVILDYGEGRHATVMVSTAMRATQHLHIAGSEGSLDLPLPFVPAEGARSRWYKDHATALDACTPESETFAPVDQYEQEITRMSRAIRGEDVALFGLDDAIANMSVLDAVFASASSGTWAEVVR